MFLLDRRPFYMNLLLARVGQYGWPGPLFTSAGDLGTFLEREGAPHDDIT